MLEHEPTFRQQLARERYDRIASDYRAAQRLAPRRRPRPRNLVASLVGSLWAWRPKHVAAYRH